MNKKIKNIVTLSIASMACMNVGAMSVTSYFLSQDKQVMVPLREVAESMGFQVDWEESTKQVTLENGTTKIVFKIGEDAYHKSTGRLSGECIMMYVPKELGEKAMLKEGKAYVPADVFDYALNEEGVLAIKDGKLIQKEGLEMSYYKEWLIELEGKTYSLSINLPEAISPYITLTSEMLEMNTTRYPICFLRFENEDGTANIGSFSVFNQEQYEAVKAEGGPVPTEVLVTNSYVVTFTGLQDMPFEVGTKASELVASYHEKIDDILKTITLLEE